MVKCVVLYTKFTSKYEIKLEKKHRVVLSQNGKGRVHQGQLCMGEKIRKEKKRGKTHKK